MAGQLDRAALIAHLERKANEAPFIEPDLLVRYAMYQGLADKISRGDFDLAPENETGPNVARS